MSKNNLPTQWIVRLLKRLTQPYYFNAIYGDLLEEFHRTLKENSTRSARWDFNKAAVMFLLKNRVFKDKTDPITTINSIDMILNFIKTSIRSFKKRTAQFLFNLAGLSIGLAAFIGISKYVYFEKSYDHFHDKSSLIYRVIRINKTESMANSKPDLAPRIMDEITDIELSTRFFTRKNGSAKIEEGGKVDVFSEIDFLYADENFFSVFSFDNNSNHNIDYLNEPNSIVITEDLSQKLFGITNAIGKTVSMKDPNFPLIDYRVRAVIPDVPENSHFTFDAVVSLNTPLRNGRTLNDMGWNGFYTYFVGGTNSSNSILKERIGQLSSVYFSEEPNMSLDIQPLTSIHLQSNLSYELGENGNIKLINYFTLTALFILIMAYINYINLSTAKSLDRAKEVGIRKALGSHKGQIIVQVFVETFILNILCMLVAFGLLLFIAPFIPLNLSSDDILKFTSTEILFLSGCIISGTVLSGLYPALILSSFQPAKILRARFNFSTKGIGMRNFLTILQFSISSVMVIVTVIVAGQLGFMMNQDKGMDISNTLIINTPEIRGDNYRSQLEGFKNKLQNNSSVVSVSTASTTPGNGYNYSAEAHLISKSVEESSLFYIDGIDERFVDHYEIKLLSGRSFSQEFTNERSNLVINKTAALELGFTQFDNAINQKVIMERDTLTIVGVIADYNHQHLKEGYDPQFLVYYGSYISHFSVKVNMSQSYENGYSIISGIEDDYKEVFTESKPDLYFLEDSFNNQYKSDVMVSSMSRMFTFISIVIAAIGLISFISFLLAGKVKEIALRRVFGASKLQIIYELSYKVIVLSTISGVLSVVISYFIASEYLSTYAFRMTLSFIHFAVPVLTIVVLTVVVLALQSIGTVSQNPVKWIKEQ